MNVHQGDYFYLMLDSYLIRTNNCFVLPSGEMERRSISKSSNDSTNVTNFLCP